MATFTATATTNHERAQEPESYTFEADNASEARHWVINHCDCSREWEVSEDKTAQETHDYLTNGLSDYHDILEAILPDCSPKVDKAWDTYKLALRENKHLKSGTVKATSDSLRKHNAASLEICALVEGLLGELYLPEDECSDERLQEQYGEYLYSPDWQDSFNWEPVEAELERELSEDEKSKLYFFLDSWAKEETFTNYWVGSGCLSSIAFGEQEVDLTDMVERIAGYLEDLGELEGLEFELTHRDTAVALVINQSDWYIDDRPAYGVEGPHGFPQVYGYYDCSDSGVMLSIDHENFAEAVADILES